MSEIRPDYCIALRMIALQEHHREAQGWLSEYLEGDDMMRAVAVSDYNALLDRCIALRAENEKLREALNWFLNGAVPLGGLTRYEYDFVVEARKRAAAAALKETGDE